MYVEDRGLQVPMTLEHRPVTSSGKSASGPDPRISHRIQIGMFRPIRVDHTNCLQVTIKTHSFSPDHTTDTLFFQGDICITIQMEQYGEVSIEIGEGLVICTDLDHVWTITDMMWEHLKSGWLGVSRS